MRSWFLKDGAPASERHRETGCGRVGHINRRFINCRFKRHKKTPSNQEAIVTEYVQLRR